MATSVPTSPPDAPTAVVTGATGTLGTALVAALAKRGLRVVAVSRSGASTGEGESAAVSADLGSDSSLHAIRDALAPDDRVAMVVHAIGLPGSPGVLDVSPAELGRAVDLKAGGLLRLVSAVDRHLSAGSRVVAVGGHLGAEPTEHAPLAGVANAALANLVRQLTGPLGRRGVTVHLAAPGPFESPRLDALVAAKARGLGVEPGEVRQQMTGAYPTGRLPTAGEVAAVIVGLLDPAASALHGSTLFLDGGVRRGIF